MDYLEHSEEERKRFDGYCIALMHYTTGKLYSIPLSREEVCEGFDVDQIVEDALGINLSDCHYMVTFQENKYEKVNREF